MKQTMLILMSFFLIITSQAQWVLRSPIATGRHLTSVHFITPAHGFVVGINHHLIETTNAGTTWTIRMSDIFGTD